MAALAKAVAAKRGYADFFEWPPKAQKELGILEAFVEGVPAIGLQVAEARLTPTGEDPPDATAVLASGERVAIELTEFVDEDAVRLQAQRKARDSGDTVWRFWTHEQFWEHLKARVARKDPGKSGPDRKRPEYWLVVHTDEPGLTLDMVRGYLEAPTPIVVRGLARCFILMSYDPRVGGYPVLQIALSRAA
jgi:hypothetical protein